MATRLRSRAATAGSALVVLCVILSVSADAGTAVALVAFSAAGVGAHRAYRSSARLAPVRSRLGARAALALTATAAALVVVAVADDASTALSLVATVVLGAVGYRSGGVVRGGLSGAAVGVAGAVALLVAGAAAVAAGALAGVPGVRALLLELLFAPAVVGFFGALWVGAVLAFAALLGLASGATGGAFGRLAGGDASDTRPSE